MAEDTSCLHADWSCGILRNEKLAKRGRGIGHVTYFSNFATPYYLWNGWRSATALQQLHWLPIKQRIHFTIATVTYRILQTGSPAYLSPLINLNTPSRTLRSASHNFLVPFTNTAVGRKAFRYAAPTVWNSIKFNIRYSPSIGSFKRHLKKYFFTLPG